MIKGTVALPVWNSQRVAWLPMESLCRQNKPVKGWELIIFEESHKTQLGEAFFRGYESRLKEVGCEQIKYLTSDFRIPLSQKWVTMAKASARTSKYFCLCGADDYYHSNLLCESEDAIEGADWLITPKGYFYDFNQDKIILYNINTLTGLHMTAKTKLARKLPMEEVNRGVDGWFTKNLIRVGRKMKGSIQVYMSFSEQWKHILCTNGLNNISLERHKYFTEVRPPFYSTDAVLTDIVPEDIAIRLKGIAKSFKVNDDLG